MRGVVVISSTGTPAGFEKHTSAVPAFLMLMRFCLDAKPPSNAARSGASPKRVMCRCAERTARVAHYWLLDPDAKTLEVERLDGETYRVVLSASEDDKVRAEPFDAIELDLGLLWRA